MRPTALLVLLLACGPEAPMAPMDDAAATLCPGCIRSGSISEDDDGDGYCEDETACLGGALPGDCDDGLAIAFPGAEERCDAIDRDCDGSLRDQFDLDVDGICDDVDLCPHDADPTQADADADGVGDACDACPGIPGALQSDADVDGLCDAIDPCVGPAGAPDANGDGLCDVAQLALTAPLSATTPGLSNQGRPDLAWSETSRVHLVTWSGPVSAPGVFARLVDARGVPVGPTRRIVRADHPAVQTDYLLTNVAWRALDDTFLVLLRPADAASILAIHVDADGAPLEDPRTLVQHARGGSVGVDDVRYDPANDTFLVALTEAVAHPGLWGHDTEYEVSTLLLDGLGRPLQPSTQRLTFTGSNDTDWYQALSPRLAHDPLLGGWTVAWRASDAWPAGGTGLQHMLRIQQLDAQGLGLGTSLDLTAEVFAGGVAPDVALTHVDIAFSPTSRRHLVVAHVQGPDPRYDLTESEVWGRLLDDQLGLVGDPFPISRVGVDGEPDAGVRSVRVTWEPKSDTFFVAWVADPLEGVMLDNEVELYGQRVTPDGDLAFAADQRLSRMGPDGARWTVGAFSLRSSAGDLYLVGDGTDPAYGGVINANQVWVWHVPWAGADLDRDGVSDLRACFGDAAFGDEDGDGICEDVDLCQGADITGDTDLDGVCDDLDLCEGDDLLGDHNADGLCDPRLEVIDLVVGAPATLALSEAPPGTTARFFASRRGTVAPTCHPSLDVCLDLRDIVSVGSATVAPDGTASVLFTPPPFAGPGRVLSFQAAWFDPVTGEGDTSAVVNATVQ